MVGIRTHCAQRLKQKGLGVPDSTRHNLFFLKLTCAAYPKNGLLFVVYIFSIIQIIFLGYVVAFMCVSLI